jgi:hypothetical protein
METAGLVVMSHPSVEKEFGESKYNGERVVVEGPVVSSRGYAPLCCTADLDLKLHLSGA